MKRLTLMSVLTQIANNRPEYQTYDMEEHGLPDIYCFYCRARYRSNVVKHYRYCLWVRTLIHLGRELPKGHEVET
jgi:hypothetical protein